MKSSASAFERVLPGDIFPILSPGSSVIFNLTSLSSFNNHNNSSTSSMDTTPSYDPYQHLTERIVYKYICLAIFLIGVIGNFLSVLVFSRSSLRRRSCAIYFLALAITDIASLCASFIDTVLPSYNNVALTTKSLFICKLNPLMVYFTQDLSNFLLAGASIDRAVSIQCPLTSKRFCQARIAIYIIIIMSVILLLINGHLFWGFEIIEVERLTLACLASNKTFAYHNKPHAIPYDRFYTIFDSVDMLFAVVVPFIVMLICNIIILIRVLTSRRSIRAIITTTIQSKKFRKRHEKEKQLTVMLLGSAAAFLVFTLPTEINDTIRVFRPSDTSQPKGAMALMTAIFIAMGQLNHAIHFYIYTLTGGVFRNELIQLFSLTKKKSPSMIARNPPKQALLQPKQTGTVENANQIDIHEF